MLQRAYSILNVKNVDQERRIITGIATTPEPDRIGDIVDPFGVKFTNPLPLLFHHNPQWPIGRVTFENPTKDGIAFEAHLPQIAEEGTLKDRVDEAWQSVKYGLIAGASIGYKVLDGAVERLKTGGLKLLKTEVLELSFVTVPMNASATIRTIKSLDVGLAATGTESGLDSSTPAGASAPVVRLARKDARGMAKTITEQISAFEATRQAKSARMVEIMTKAGDEGVTLDPEQSEEYDGLEREVKSIDDHLTRLAALEKANKAAAKPVNGDNPEHASASRGGHVISVKDNLPPGIEFARYAMCLAATKGNTVQALEVAKLRYPDNQRIHLVLKAAVSAGTTTDATWAGALVDYTNLAGEFIEYLRPQTIVGKFGTNGIPSLNRVPFNIRVIGQTSGGEGYWVGQGAPKPVTKVDFSPTTLTWAKVANIAVLTEELVRFSSPSAEALVRQALSAAIIARIDTDFVDPNKAAVANVSPASITNGLTPIATVGSSAADVRVDMAALFAPFIAANLAPDNGVFIMSTTTALSLSLMQNDLGQPEFNGITMKGGTFMGLPVITSQYVAVGSPVSNLVILVNASDIYLADDGQVVIDASREASLQMADDPTNNSATPTATTLVSLWQTNSIGLRAERFINWARRRAEAVAYIEDVVWGVGGGSPA